jgi:hypothetical protein
MACLLDDDRLPLLTWALARHEEFLAGSPIEGTGEHPASPLTAVWEHALGGPVAADAGRVRRRLRYGRIHAAAYRLYPGDYSAGLLIVGPPLIVLASVPLFPVWWWPVVAAAVVAAASFVVVAWMGDVFERVWRVEEVYHSLRWLKIDRRTYDLFLTSSLQRLASFCGVGLVSLLTVLAGEVRSAPEPFAIDLRSCRTRRAERPAVGDDRLSAPTARSIGEGRHR